jgi:hypothetical protein
MVSLDSSEFRQAIQRAAAERLTVELAYKGVLQVVDIVWADDDYFVAFRQHTKGHRVFTVEHVSAVRSIGHHERVPAPPPAFTRKGASQGIPSSSLRPSVSAPQDARPETIARGSPLHGDGASVSAWYRLIETGKDAPPLLALTYWLCSPLIIAVLGYEWLKGRGISYDDSRPDSSSERGT